MAKVTAKYQITIPPKVREALRIVPGCEVDIQKKGSRYVLIVDPIAELKKNWQGKFKDKQTSDEYMNQIRGEIM
ncbi:MAG: AbrB/MazE/SpoVT family DNA-binding domain-containing protein [Deltaproteobacteria bacterium]|jgi:AbrB family looped-hinge helix DNA binding protein|nr:AbrB/MazE/SpoVT family DNA-binding domain-containing protein [Deltaproteobacteria bacterium]